jgi:hypothetical protein
MPRWRRDVCLVADIGIGPSEIEQPHQKISGPRWVSAQKKHPVPRKKICKARGPRFESTRKEAVAIIGCSVRES